MLANILRPHRGDDRLMCKCLDSLCVRIGFCVCQVDAPQAHLLFQVFRTRQLTQSESSRRKTCRQLRRPWRRPSVCVWFFVRYDVCLCVCVCIPCKVPCELFYQYMIHEEYYTQSTLDARLLCDIIFIHSREPKRTQTRKHIYSAYNTYFARPGVDICITFLI